MRSMNSFKAVYCSGLAIPSQATVTALGLLFERVYLPNNIEFVLEFSKKYRLNVDRKWSDELSFAPLSPGVEHPFFGLTPAQQDTAYNYLGMCFSTAMKNHELFGNVIETDAFDGGVPLLAELIKQGSPGELNTYRVSKVPLNLVSEDDHKLSNLISSGYIPVVGGFGNVNTSAIPMQGTTTAKALAALLAIKSVEMFFPATVGAPAEVILEARERLRDQLPLFWSAMFKLSVDLKRAIEECVSSEEVVRVGVEMVDTIVRPALTDLNHKIELERKNWFRRVFGEVYKGLRVVAANPPLTPDQLIRSALALGADAAISASDQVYSVEKIKSEAGLTYLLELDALLGKS